MRALGTATRDGNLAGLEEPTLAALVSQNISPGGLWLFVKAGLPPDIQAETLEGLASGTVTFAEFQVLRRLIRKGLPVELQEATLTQLEGGDITDPAVLAILAHLKVVGKVTGITAKALIASGKLQGKAIKEGSKEVAKQDAFEALEAAKESAKRVRAPGKAGLNTKGALQGDTRQATKAAKNLAQRAHNTVKKEFKGKKG